MAKIWLNNFLPNRYIEQAMQAFGKEFSASQRVLDIGCGHKPYQRYFRCTYIGLDPLPAVNPDLVGNAWDIPAPDCSFDGVIMNQSLEHIAETQTSIAEVRRVLKPGGRAVITVPQTMKNHSQALSSAQAPVHNFNRQEHPYWQVDYYRFTKYGLCYIWRDFTIVSLRETTGYLGTLIQLINYLIASFGDSWFLRPWYVLANTVGLILDAGVRYLSRWPGPIGQKLHFFVDASLTINYILIVEKPR